MRAAIHQPNFLPRLKVLQKIAAADAWVVLDSVQYCSAEWQNRARLVASHGDSTSFWVTVPVNRPGGRSTRICDVSIVDPIATSLRLRRSIHHAFRRAPYWRDVEPFLEDESVWSLGRSLARMCVATTAYLLQLGGKVPTILYSSSIGAPGRGSGLMASIVRRIGAATYLADSGAGNYLDPRDFTGVQVLWQRWEEPPQGGPRGCMWRDLSAINYLARHGAEAFREHVGCGAFEPRSAEADD